MGSSSRSMIEDFEAGRAPAFQLYALGLDHKHLPEMRHYSGLDREPLFVPSVGNFYQGMLVSIPLHLDALPGAVTAQRLRDVLVERYAGSELVAVQPAGADVGGGLSPEGVNGSNRLELFVHAHAGRGHALLVARLDNLGKGASGAAAQNLELMLADG
jgi:N-acetyl-gamma-glutamyl-phosphate reductase